MPRTGTHEQQTVGELVQQDPRARGVLIRFGIEPDHQADATLGNACRHLGIDTAAVLEGLARLDRDLPAGPRPPVDLGRLCDFVVSFHHEYVQRTAPQIAEWLETLTGRYGAEQPALARLSRIFAAVAMDMASHMRKEEQILFPAISDMAQAARERRPLAREPFATVLHPIRVMESEHDRVDRGMAEVCSLVAGLTAPTPADPTWRRCMAEIARFAEDLDQHVHLENFVLFPRALELERQLS